MTTEADLPPSEWRDPLCKGMSGADCGAWQNQLMADDHDLSPYNADEDFGGRTHNATVSWQRSRDLKPDGEVGEKTRGAIGNPTRALEEPTAIGVEDSEIEFVEARRYGARGDKNASRDTVDLIVIHSMEAGEASTTAENVAAWGASSSGPRASWHYAIDDNSIVQSVREYHMAWHVPGANRQVIGLDHAGYAPQSEAEWRDQFSSRMLKRSALLSARICKRWDIPVEKLDSTEVKTGRGFCGHHDVSLAFGKSDHYDPGPNFPWEKYISMVQEAFDGLG